MGSIGPVFALVGVAVATHEIREENKQDKKLLDARRSIQKQFKDVAVDLESQIKGQFQEFEQQVYDDIQFSITLARKERENEISTSSKNCQALFSIRETLNSALANVRDLATPLL